MDYADFPIIDISKAGTTEGRQELAPIVRDAMRTYGFLYIVNHGLTQKEVNFQICPQPQSYLICFEQNDRMCDIANIPFSQVSEEEKRAFTGKIKEVGSYRGYKPRQFWVYAFLVETRKRAHCIHQTIDNGVRDQIEHYNSAFVVASVIRGRPNSSFIVHRPIFHQQHPKALQPFLPELRAFSEHNYYNVLHPVLRYVPFYEPLLFLLIRSQTASIGT